MVAARVTLQNAEVLYVAASETTVARVSRAWANTIWDTSPQTTVARASRAWADVAWGEDSLTTVARASKVWVDVVWSESTGEEIEKSAENELVPTDEATRLTIFTRSVSQGPSLQDQVYMDAILNLSGSGSLDLGHEASAEHWLPQSVQDPLTIQDEHVLDTVLSRGLSDAFSLEDAHGALWTFQRDIPDPLTLVDEVSVDHWRGLAHPLSLSDQALVTWIDIEIITDPVTIEHTSSGQKIAPRSHEDLVALEQVVEDAWPIRHRWPEQSLTLSDLATVLIIDAWHAPPRTIRMSLENQRPARMRR
jgi:hypothetical protein